MGDTWRFVIEVLAIVSFAISGAMVALKEKMDPFGVSMLGLCTAVGGGILRDLLLGITPPYIFTQPLYAVIAIAVSLIVFLPRVRHMLLRSPRAYDVTMLITDSLGLGLFTVVGVKTVMTTVGQPHILGTIFLGMLTATGGGVLRDILAGHSPYIFSKHFYALPSLAGAVVCTLLWNVWGEGPVTITATALVVLLRFLAARYHWNLPQASDEEDIR